MSRILSTLKGTSWDGTPIAGEAMVTDSSYHDTYAFQAASQLMAVQRFGSLRRELKSVRAYMPFMVNLIIRRSMQDMIGENVPVILYAKSGQPSHAATQAVKIWERVARANKTQADPWPAEDSEATMEQIDDGDFQQIIRDARVASRVDRNFFCGHPKDPWAVMIGDTSMADELLINLKMRGPTYGGTIPEDLPVGLGGRGIEMEASLDQDLLEDTHSTD